MAEQETRPGPDVDRDASVTKIVTTSDAFLGGRLDIIQPASGYRAGVDAVLLAAAVPSGDGPLGTLLDCGAGVGTVGLCAAVGRHGLDVVLLEREEALVAFAQQNVVRNKLDGRVRVVCGDVLNPPADIVEHQFSHVVANPPFFSSGRGTTSPDRLRASGREMDDAELDRWIRFMARVAAPSGLMYMIHQASALPTLLTALEGRFGEIRIVPIFSKPDMPANRIILIAKKGSRAPLTILPAFVLHEADGPYTQAAQDVLNHGAPLDLF